MSAKYIGPKTKISRRFRECIFKEDKYFERKKYYYNHRYVNYRRRSKKSEYLVQLVEKQKARYIYGILEKQFKKMFFESSKKKGITGELLLQLCESRLDNVVFRLKFSLTRASARQIVNHRHIIVNNNIVNIPSFRLHPGDVVKVKENSKKHPVILNSLYKRKDNVSMEWLKLDETSMSGFFLHIPKRQQIPEKINEQLIVELYSK